MDSFNQNNVKANLHDTNFSRIGIITLSTDFTIEQDFRKICHNLPVDLFFNRIPFLNPLTHENYLKMADYITETTNQILPNEKIQVVAYGCTSGTIEIGEKRIRSEIFKAKPDALITTPITSAVKALKLLNHKKIAVLTPYPKDVNIKVYKYLIDSIDKFYNQDQLTSLIIKAGFANVEYRNVSNGISAIHSGWKI